VHTATTSFLPNEDGHHPDRPPAPTRRSSDLAPTIQISGAANVDEGSAYSLTLGAVTDPGQDTVSSWVVNWGDGNSDTYGTDGARSHTHTSELHSPDHLVCRTHQDGTYLDRAN